MLTEDQKKLLHIQLKCLDEIIRAIIYTREIRKKYPEAPLPQRFIANSLAEIVVIKWCQVFGVTSEDTHWKNLNFDHPGYAGFCRHSILEGTGLTEDEWAAYWKSMTDLRNEFFAHFDMDSMSTRIPSFEPALRSAIAYREWIYNLTRFSTSQGHTLGFGAPITPMLIRLAEQEGAAA